MELYDKLKEKAIKLFTDAGIIDQTVTVKTKILSIEEAIGNPEHDDFPLQKGKERLMMATFGNGSGQAFTDMFGNFEGTLKEVMEMPINNNYRGAIFIATLNAALNHLGKIEKTIHCKDNEPVECAKKLIPYIKEKYPETKKIGQIGLQPRMLEAMSKEFSVRLLDLDPDNIGTYKFNTLVEGQDSKSEVIEWADILVATGSTVVNGTIEDFIGDKPVIFYGTTVAGAAYLMGWERFCECAR